LKASEYIKREEKKFCTFQPTSINLNSKKSMSDLKEQKQAPPAAAPAAELDPVAAAKKAAKEAKNEEKRLAKMAKFAAKQAKVNSETDLKNQVLIALL
jgi:hypothetical protein